MATILQITDAHLSPRHPFFRSNFERLRRAAEALRPDLVVATGDLSLDGAGHEVDLRFAAALHRALPAPLLALPGNHDVGSHARTMPHQPVDAARLARWEAHLGPSWGLVDLPGWRVAGLNTEVMGTGLPAEAAQARFAAEAAAGLGARRLALFLHKPVFVTTPEDPTFDYWSVPPAARADLAPLTAHPALRLVGSGHLHLHRRFRRDGVEYAWAPAASFVVNPRDQEGLEGERLCGMLVHRLGEDGVASELVVPEGMEAADFDAIRPVAYPQA